MSRMRLGNWAVISSAVVLAVMAGVGLLVNIAGSNGAHARAKTVAGSGGSSRAGCTMPRAAFHSESDYRSACMVQKEGLVPPRLQSILNRPLRSPSARTPTIPVSLPQTPAQMRTHTGIIANIETFGLGNMPQTQMFGLHYTSGWQSEYWSTGYQYIVLAGYVRRDKSQGAVWWQEQPLHEVHNADGTWYETDLSMPGAGHMGTVYTPTKVGALRVVSFTANTLSLDSTNGSKFVFSLSTHALRPK
ncbi:MAG: hypothetical protein M0008_01785 [Actinomycetota bacterium]|nr:hypothetical protein [Actinomycetota bacterium]